MRVGPYEILEEAGRGGRGVVLKARAADGRIVAVKVLQAGSDAQALARFDRERRLLAMFGEGEGFVPLLDAGTQQGAPYLVMPFLEGGTLRQRLEKGALDVPAATALVSTLARAMGTAHERGVVHRDLKPENVLFTADGAPLIADLGLGKHFKHGTPGASQTLMLSKVGQLRGTIGYMAPEQARDAMNAGPPADVFSLGAILHECLTGTPAFLGESPMEVIAKIEHGRYEKRALARDHRWLEAIVAKALDPRVERRYADARALANAIAAGPGAKRPRRAAPLIGALLVVVAGLAAVIFTLVTRGEARAALGDPRERLAAARAATDGASRVAAARAAIECAKGDAPDQRALRGEAYEIVARARLADGDAVGAFAAAREALAAAPADEARQLLVAQSALRAGRADDALAAVAKQLEKPDPPIEALRAAAAAHLAHGRFAEAEAAAHKALASHRDDPELLLVRGRSLRGLGRQCDALAPLAAAERAGEKDARAELALASIEAVKVPFVRDPRELYATLDLPPDKLDAQVDALIEAFEKHWAAARAHPDAPAVGFATLERICTSIAKARAIQPKHAEEWAPRLARVRKVHDAVVALHGPEELEADSIFAALACYANDLALAERCAPRAAGLPIALRFTLRATLGISYFVAISSAASIRGSREGNRDKGIAALDAAISEEPAALARAEEEDLFLRELHRAALRVRCEALLHRAWADPRQRDDLARAPDVQRSEEAGRAALAVATVFEAFGDAPVQVALAPALLAQGKLDEAEKVIVDLEAFQERWASVQESSRQFGRSQLNQSWGEVFELRGDLELRRGHFTRALTAFERATRELDARSSWFGLARARRELGDLSGAEQARREARADGRRAAYLPWLGE